MQTSVVNQLVEGPSALPSDRLLKLARSFEDMDELLEAETLYRELIQRDEGLEARVRYAHLLLKLDEPLAARYCIARGLEQSLGRFTRLSRTDWRWLSRAFLLWKDLRGLQASGGLASRWG